MTVVDIQTWKDWLLIKKNEESDLQRQGKPFSREEEEPKII